MSWVIDLEKKWKNEVNIFCCYCCCLHKKLLLSVTHLVTDRWDLDLWLVTQVTWHWSYPLIGHSVVMIQALGCRCQRKGGSSPLVLWPKLCFAGCHMSVDHSPWSITYTDLWHVEVRKASCLMCTCDNKTSREFISCLQVVKVSGLLNLNWIEVMYLEVCLLWQKILTHSPRSTP